MSLRTRLEAKDRRHLDHPVLVGDARVAAAAVQVAQAELLAAESPDGDSEQVPGLRAALEAADAAYLGCFATVAFDAMDPDDYEDLVTAHLDPQSGEIDQATCLPALAAACVVDEDLKDEQWWAAQFAKGTWSAGERADLYHQLYLLNRTAPGLAAEALGKG